MKKLFTLLFLLPLAGLFAQTTFDIEAHRGGRGLFPENTITSFMGGLKLGVNTLEMDVVVTKDGKLVISHDRWMNPDICRGADGKELTADPKENYAIYNMTYAEVETYDCGSYGNPKFPEQQKIAAHKPLLSQVIDSVENYIKANHLPHIYYNIETKSTADGDGKYNPKPDVFAKMLYDELKQKGILKYCIIQSFDVRTLQEIKKIDSTVVTALLIGDMNSFEKNLQQLGYTPEIYSPIYMLVNKKLIANCHKKGIRIIPWTVNDEKKMLKLKQQGVDGLITDYPNIAVKVLR